MAKQIQTNLRNYKSALRFVLNDYTTSYESLLANAKLLSLSMNRLKLLGIEMYKCTNKMNPGYLKVRVH